ncbi:MAG: NAD(P)-dependent oxidoreductase [Candidatus Thorarchaeota archaeon]
MKALITAPFSESGLKELSDAGIDVNYKSWLETGKLHLGESLLEVMRNQEYDIVVVEGDEVKEEVIEGTNLKIIGCARGDPKNIDVALATAKGIPVISAPGRNTIAVAELTIGLMLNQLRNFTTAERILQSEFLVDDFSDFAGMYTRTTGFELHGRTVGLIGFGAIGYEVAMRLRAFGTYLLVNDPYADTERVQEVGAEQVNLHDLLKRSDVVSVHSAVTDETQGMIGADEFALMKPSAIFINTARASITDEYALLEALKSKRIAGAGLDVFSMEPVDCDNIFLELDNVTVTPHIGGNTVDTIERQSTILSTDILTFLSGGKPKHTVNPEVFG